MEYFQTILDDISEGLRIVNELRIKTVIHSLPTNTYSAIKVRLIRKLHDTWMYESYAQTGRVTSYFVAVDEDSVKEATGLVGNLFNDEDVPEVFALTLTLLSLYLILTLLETPHIGLCSFM